MYSPGSRYNTPVGVSLRTLAKLTNPAMARWWRKRGLWLLGAGVGCGVISLCYHIVECIRLLPSISVVLHVPLLQALMFTMRSVALASFGLLAIYSALASVTACHDLDDESALPRSSMPLSSVYTLALLRAWPAPVASAAFLILLGLLDGWHMTVAQYIQALPSQLPLALSNGINGAGEQLVVVLWLAAFVSMPQYPSWHVGMWATARYIIPGAIEITIEAIVTGLQQHRALDYIGILTTNSYLIELAAIGIGLLVLLLWLLRRKERRAASGISLMLALGCTLAVAWQLPGVNPHSTPIEWRFPIQNLAQLAHWLVKLPTHTFHSDAATAATATFYCTMPKVHYEIPLSLSFISPLLNLAWLAALYLFISRVLLREPRKIVNPD